MHRRLLPRNLSFAFSALLLFAISVPATFAFAQQPEQAPPPQPPAQQSGSDISTPQSAPPTNQTQPNPAQPDQPQPVQPQQDQTQPAPSPNQKIQVGPNGVYTLRTNVSEVVLYATVVDDQQHLVTTLHQPDFTVYEDNVPQRVVSFREQDVPVSLAILVDNSASMQEKRAAINLATIRLVRASNPQDEAFVVNFSDQAFLDQDFTSRIPLLEKGLSHIDSKGGTALYDAVIAGADHLSQKAQRPKQVLLLITDGEDNSSSSTLAETVQRIQQLNGPIVYCIGLLYAESGRSAHQARKALQTLSDQTGGIAFFPRSLDQVDSIAAEVARDIRQQYVIGYHPSRPITTPGYRAIHVTAAAPGYSNLTVRTRQGYFAGSNSHSPSNKGGTSF